MGTYKIQTVIDEIVKMNPQKIVISNPRDKSGYRRIDIVRILIKKEECYQIASYTEKQVFHNNIPIDDLTRVLNDYTADYKQINAFSEEKLLEAKINKSMNAVYSIKCNDSYVPKISAVTNNRKKNYVLEEGMNIPIFVELGIFTKDYKIVNSKYDKFRQINRFTEMLADVLKDYHKDEINIIDFGCGKSYLTFVVYYYLTQIMGIRANIIGLDLKADVIEKCSKLAQKYGYNDLRFEIGDINGYKTPFDVDMVITLHACDTATDYALYNAIYWKAKYIMSVPCCQHELNKKIKSERLLALTKYGIVKERISALMTDAIRGCVLEYCGYKTDLLEFVDIEHSPKNILIRATKKNVSDEKRQKSKDEAIRLMQEFETDQTLAKLIFGK